LFIPQTVPLHLAIPGKHIIRLLRVDGNVFAKYLQAVAVVEDFGEILITFRFKEMQLFHPIEISDIIRDKQH